MSEQTKSKSTNNYLKLLSLTLVIIMTVVFYGCAKEQNPAESIKADPVNYYISNILPLSFTYPDNDKKISMQTNDRSFIQFQTGFKTLTMGFDTGAGDYKYLYFVVTNCSLKNNNIKAAAERIYKGGILRFTITSDHNYIYFKSDFTYTLITDSEENDGKVEVTRNTTVLIYHRTAPGYI